MKKFHSNPRALLWQRLWLVCLLVGGIAAHAPLVVAQVASVSVTPNTASAGAELTIRGQGLGGSAPYQALLVSDQAVQLLGSGTSTSGGSLSISSLLPNVAEGRYRLVLRDGRGQIVAETVFDVIAGVSLTTLTSPVRAGRLLELQVEDIDASGSLRLTYMGRSVYGPQPVEAGQVLQAMFVVPADVPENHPALVTLHAEVESARGGLQTASIDLYVQAPFTGPFLSLSNVASDRSEVRSNERFRLTGRIQVDGGPPPAGLDFSAWWFGDNGQVLPLGGPPLQLSAQGDFVLETAAPSLGSLGAADAVGPGRVGFASRRQTEFGTASAASDLAILPGPFVQFFRDDDPDIDINIWVRGEDGPLQGALVRIVGGLPLVDPVNQPNSIHESLGLGLSQANPFDHLSLPPPGCPPSLSTQYTGANGGAEFVIKRVSTNGHLIGAMTAGDTWAAGLQPAGCVDIPTNPPHTESVCFGGEPLINEFEVQIWTLHLGYGRVDHAAGGEKPEIWKIRHHKVTNSFTMTNPRTGQVVQQNTSANLTVFPPKRVGNDVLIGDPSVTGLRRRPNTGFLIDQPVANFVALPDFSQPPLGTFITFSPSEPMPRRMEFRHVRDADGELTSAQLRLPSSANPNQLVSWGTFSRVQGTGGGGDCPGSAYEQGDLYRLEFSSALKQAMRRPNLSWPGKDKVCGNIRVHIGPGRTGSRMVCFHWADLPEAVKHPGHYTVTELPYLNEQVMITAGNSPGGQQHSSMPAPPPEYNVGRRDNNAARNYGLFHIIDDGVVVRNLSKIQGTHEQFSKSADLHREPEAEAASGGNFGSPEWKTLVDHSVRLFQWTWGVPGLFGASVYAELRVLAEHLFRGRWNAAGSIAELEAAARMQLQLMIGVDISILFGALADIGATITGSIGSEMRVEMEDGAVLPARTGLFFIWGIYFNGWVEIGCVFPGDFTCLIPDIEEEFPIAEGQERLDGPSTASKSLDWIPTPLPAASDIRGPLTAAERKALFRHPAVAFDRTGFGIGLMLDEDDQLVAIELQGRVPGAPQVISAGHGIRSTAIVFPRNGQAVAAWVESTLSQAEFLSANLEQRVTAQRVHYAVWNGVAWSAKQPLWATPGGDTSVALAGCIENFLCSRDSVATLVFSHRHGGSLGAPDQRTWYAAFSNGAFESPRLVDASNTPRLEVSPSVTYVGIIPTRVVGFVRYVVPELERVDTRQFVYRHFGSSVLHQVAGMQGEIATPVLDGRGSILRVAFTRPDRHTGFAGTRQALHYTQGSCDSSGSCSLGSGHMVLDANGRSIYGIAPRLVRSPDGNPLVMLRSFGFGPDASGNRVLPGDPVGTASLSGDLLGILINPANGSSAVQPLTNDGRLHFQSAVAFDALHGETVALSSVLSVPVLDKNADQWRARLGPQTGKSLAVAKLAGGSVELHAARPRPDPALLAISTAATQLNPGSGLTASVQLANLGAELDADQAALGRIQFRLDAPTGSGPPLVTISLPALKPGEVRDVPIVLLMPDDVSPDEARDLYAVLVLDAALEQADGSNDTVSRRIGDLPTPYAMEWARTSAEPFVWIGWEAAEDARVIGYRIYAEDVAGQITPLGSSPVKGFLDLSARFDRERRYYVRSYSASGTESPLSPAVSAKPPKAPLSEPIFTGTFESNES